MKKSKYSEAKIVTILKEAEAGMTVAEISRKYGVSNGTFYNWKSKYAGTKRFAKLRKLGVGEVLAAKTASSAHGPWRISYSPALNCALPNTYFNKLGLVKLIDRPNA